MWSGILQSYRLSRQDCVKALACILCLLYSCLDWSHDLAALLLAGNLMAGNLMCNLNINWVSIPLPCGCLGVLSWPLAQSLCCWSSCTLSFTLLHLYWVTLVRLWWSGWNFLVPVDFLRCFVNSPICISLFNHSSMGSFASIMQKTNFQH